MVKRRNNIQIKYNFPNFDPLNLDPHNIDRLAVEKIPNNASVLDIGCATGFMGKYLIEKKQCKVFGIDIRKKELTIAKKNLTGVLLTNIENKENMKKILIMNRGRKFDVILATSVIEHLVNPSAFLKNVQMLMRNNSIIIVSTPNIAHWTMRLSLLKGNFDYSEYGILDNTHLHFFTYKTFVNIFKNNNFHIDEICIDNVGGGYPKISSFLSTFFPHLFAYQLLIIAHKK